MCLIPFSMTPIWTRTGDGKTNIEELESGTDPQDKLSLFQVMQMTPPRQP